MDYLSILVGRNASILCCFIIKFNTHKILTIGSRTLFASMICPMYSARVVIKEMIKLQVGTFFVDFIYLKANKV